MATKKAKEKAEAADFGFVLWGAALDWRDRFAEAMAEAGYPWHLEAAGEVLTHLGPAGRNQAELAREMGMTKQAVQQLIDQLEKKRVVKRAIDPDDRRANRVELTALGLRDNAEQRKVKRRIETVYKRKLGAAGLEKLRQQLEKLAK